MSSASRAEPSSNPYSSCVAWLNRAQQLRFAALKALQSSDWSGITPPPALSELARKVGVMPYELFRAFRVAGGYRRCWEDFVRLLREL